MIRSGTILLAVTAALLAAGCGSSSTEYHRNGGTTPGAPSTTVAETEAEKEFEAARSLLAELKYAEAERKLVPLIGRFNGIGKTKRAAEAAFWSGYCCEQRELFDDARALYSRVIRDYPKTPAARQAAARLGRLPAK
jgi:TolA-binding protein